jgi:4'-phosphopantetheinyl transferase
VEWLPCGTYSSLSIVKAVVKPVRIHHQVSEETAQDLRQAGFVVLVIQTTRGIARAEARRLARSALRDCLQRYFGCDSNAVTIETVPGNAPVAMFENQRIYVSFSYESDIAWIAIDLMGPIGIDAVYVIEQTEWIEECVEVAKAYLPAEDTRQIARLAGLARTAAFARHWALHEARLKCAELPLQEWGADMEIYLRETQVFLIEESPSLMVAYARKQRKSAPVTG